MARMLISIRGGISIALAFLAAATLLWIASAKTIGSTAKDTTQWDDKASKELTAGAPPPRTKWRTQATSKP